ncbi:MAG TPA: T9SS type A sorting domain-containing protein, partial [Verrucomicrobiae bacterium]|nr:T9SS type A sorting domain-containing protein [Verrucomicrobiae bacterium]
SSSPFYSPDAISDMDFIAVYYDTLKDPRLVTTPDPENGKPHKPMGLRIEQRSHSWSAEWGQDWVLLDYTITNMGDEPIRKAYIGLFMDPSIGNFAKGTLFSNDDYTAFQTRIKPDSCLGGGALQIPNIENLNIAYAYDNDGDPEEGSNFGLSSSNPTGALGVKILRAREALRPDGTLAAGLSFNWWIPDASGLLDWGPQHAPGLTNSFGRRGQPMGDVMRYKYLSNREIDYDQIMSTIIAPDLFVDTLLQSANWLLPLEPFGSAVDIANGADNRFLLSSGPFELDVGESVPVTFAVFAASAFHTDPANFQANFPNPSDFQNPNKVRAYKQSLAFQGLFENSRMARKVFDNDTKSFLIFCTFRCTPMGGCVPLNVRRFHGDGVPDFKGPVPPPYPKVEFSTGEGEVTIRWFGKETENATDPISGLQDFEGYSIQMSPDGVNYTIIGYFDRINWRGYFINRDVNQDGIPDAYREEPLSNRPLSYEEIQNLYAVNWDTCANKPGNITKPIDPKRFNALPLFNQQPLIPAPNPWCDPDTSSTAARVRFCDNCGPSNTKLDTMLFFLQEGFNLGLDQARMYPSVIDPANDSAYWYQYKISGLFPSQPLWFSVVPFDNGMVTFTQKIDPQAASPYAGAYLVYPIATDSARKAEELKISVYPNPYRVDHDYSFFEKKLPVSGHPQSSQRINFVNLPPRCVIRIYTLDGDLVQQINHDKNPNASDSGYDFWDLLSRNAQKVVAGMYIFSVDSNEGRYVGKILIIQ